MRRPFIDPQGDQGGVAAVRDAGARRAVAGQPAACLHARKACHAEFHSAFPTGAHPETVRHLRRQGIKADYLAIGRSPHWNQCDINFVPSPIPPLRALQEFWLFWTTVARYQVVHAHFMYTISETGWELPLLKSMNRKLVAHFRGCEARDRTRNMQLHPDINICQSCDHHPYVCQTLSAARRRVWAEEFADATLVTTPDEGLAGRRAPFFSADVAERNAPLSGRPFTIVHITNQPESKAPPRLSRPSTRSRPKADIDFRCSMTFRTRSACEIANADLVGKMKMGYYANAQIETMSCGVPTVTMCAMNS